MSKNSLYKLKKSKEILLQTFRRYKRKKNTLLVNDTEEIKTALLELQERILEEDRRGADESAKQVETLAKIFLPKSSVLKFVNFIGALLFALFVAVLVRSMLIEPYEIPSGSMRPTLQEQDRLVVTKSDFGINIPLLPKHFYFDPSLVKRAATFIFTGANMDIHDVNTMYFYLFPGKKQFVKRMMGKPGDTLYFYGGRMYGINKDGLDISKELQPSSLDHINHVPFIHLDGKVIANKKLSDGIFSPIYFAQMNKQIAKMEITPFHTIKTELLTKKSNPLIKHYFDLWGFKNYAVARLLAANDLDSSSTISGDASLYLELIHHPNLENAKIERDPYGRVRPSLGYNKSIIPLTEKHLKTLFNNLYTARFVIKNEAGYRWGSSRKKDTRFAPEFIGVPNGTYEFFDGTAYQIKWGGIKEKLPPNHSLYTFSPDRIRIFFNIGMEFDKRFLPEFAGPNLFSSRYAFFREGDLFVMNAPLLEKGDPEIDLFIQNEQKKKSIASSYSPYFPFIDEGAPLLENGALDTRLIKEYGMTVPDKEYLALGDNYANSADTRDFGFVPEDNIRGAPAYIFWPPGPRFGLINQPRYPLFSCPNVIAFSLTILLIVGWWIIHKKRNRLPIDFD